MHNLDNYKLEKKEILEKIEDIQEEIYRLENLGVDVSGILMKLRNATRILQEDKISVVLVGAFSDGKTSVISGLLNEKVDNMKISSDESSDQILCYIPNSFPEDCQIVDTPGLFGDKTRNNGEGLEIALSDITKEYISEANIILYVVAAKNPLKNSHKDCVTWMLKGLNKAESIIFVINRMDDVSDLTDEEDFSLQAKIKINNLRSKLLDFEIDQELVENVDIVCISAAPNGKNVEDWKLHHDEYLRRSRLESLERLTNKILESQKENLINKTGYDILNSEISRLLRSLSDQETRITNDVLPKIEDSLNRNIRNLEVLRKKLIKSRKEIKEKVKRLQKRKINYIRAMTIENFENVIEDEVGILKGQEGHVLNDEINDIFQEYSEKYYDWTKELGSKLDIEYDKQNAILEEFFKIGAKGLAGEMKNVGDISVETLKNGIFRGQELLGKINIRVKFKPWQVSKMAKFTNNVLPKIGLGIDIAVGIVENFAIQEKNRIFSENKEEIKNEINNIFCEIIESLNDERKYIENFAPDYIILEARILEEKVSIQKQKDLLKDCRNWIDNVKTKSLN